MDKVCSLIKEWITKQLLLRSNYACDIDSKQSPTILKQIKKVKFPNLQSIDLALAYNLIESVEELNQFHLPNLESLDISTSANI